MRERKNGVIEWTMRHYQITLLVITVLVGLGILGLVDMPKQEFPEFTIRQGVVVGVYPGATSGEVEEQLAKPLERYLFTFKEVKKKKDVLHVKGWNGVRNGGAERRREQ